jgi:hypothetical protein
VHQPGCLTRPHPPAVAATLLLKATARGRSLTGRHRCAKGSCKTVPFIPGWQEEVYALQPGRLNVTLPLDSWSPRPASTERSSVVASWDPFPG